AAAAGVGPVAEEPVVAGVVVRLVHTAVGVRAGVRGVAGIVRAGFAVIAVDGAELEVVHDALLGVARAGVVPRETEEARPSRARNGKGAGPRRRDTPPGRVSGGMRRADKH